MRQIVLDTETTGLETELGHRIIEIGAVELLDRQLTGQHFHYYLNPQRDIDDGALEVHGISHEFLQDKPLFVDIVDEFLAFIKDAELIIHNAPFDVGFLDYELGLLEGDSVQVVDYAKILDTLVLARDLHPGQRNSLDALCKRYEVDNSSRTLHGALLDAEILADVYLIMTGGQTDLGLTLDNSSDSAQLAGMEVLGPRMPLKVLQASPQERALHQSKLAAIQQQAGECLWLEQESAE